MIVKVRCENQWLYFADVDEVKTEETCKEGEKITVSRLYIFQRNNPKTVIIELKYAVAYLLNDEGKTIERIN